MPPVGFEPTISVLEQAKTVLALYSVAPAINTDVISLIELVAYIRLSLMLTRFKIML
jgi:hypothetical protein